MDDLETPVKLTPKDAEIIRRRKNMKQADFAKRVGVGQPTVSAWETGRFPITKMIELAYMAVDANLDGLDTAAAS